MRWLLRLYPSTWRRRYQREVEAFLEESAPSAAAAIDLVGGALDAHRREGALIRRAAPLVLFVLVAVIIGWLNYHASDDVQPVAAALLLAGLGFALWRPRRWWLVIAALWVAVPISSIVGYMNNYHPGLVKPAPLYETLVALVPAGIGVAAGCGLASMRR